MNKQDLSKRRALKATSKMMQLASADTPRGEKYSYYHRVIYQRGMYMRCRIQNGILVVGFFLAEHMRVGGRNPAYELFIDRKRKQFLTYDRLHDKWHTAKLDRLDWPAYVFGSEQRWINQLEYDLIKNYLSSEHGGYEGLLAYQRQIRHDELKQRHKKETDPWDMDLAQVPKLPKDWKRWVDKVGIPQNYIFYHYSRKGADTGYCTYCEKDVPVRRPRHNKDGRCPCCHHKITFKSVGKAGTVVTERAPFYLIQRCNDGFVIREFTGYRKYPKGKYDTPECSCSEIRRVIYNQNACEPRAYFWGVYKQCESRWMRTAICSASWQGNDNGRIYGRTLPDLSKKELRQTGLVEALRCLGVIDPEKYLAILHAAPYLEKLAKANLPSLVYECMSNYYNFQNNLHDLKADGLTKMLGISSQALKRLRLKSGGLRFLDWLKHEKATGKILSDNMIDWFCSEKITVKDFQFIRDRMSVVQIYNYLRRQMSIYNTTSKDVLSTWSDYRSMARRLKMDTSDAIIFRVNKLYQRHDELVKLCHDKELAIRADEILKQYPHVDDICGSLKEKYEYAGSDYTIIAPSCVEDILLEGRALHHCVDKSDRYWERIERRETYVLFLRKTSEIDKPYYTLEIEPNGTVRQKRTMYNRQEADIDKAAKFLTQWQTVVSKRITPVDLKLAEESHILRNQEYAQLRENRAIIHTGDLAGKLLVDVLLADLMENTTIKKAA